MKFVDLFAGAGGLSCGLEMAGFKAVGAGEIHPCYAHTYQRNHPDTKVLIADIRELAKRDVCRDFGFRKGELDLVAGGPPCQGFSINAPIRNLDDPRNHLFMDFIRIAEKLAPKAILIENVPGIISLGQGTVVARIYDELGRLGYSADHRILFAAHYGVPQMRFRTIFIAIKGKGVNIEFPQPEYNATAVANFAGARERCLQPLPLFSGKLRSHTTVWEAISDLPALVPGKRNEEYEYPQAPQSPYQHLMRNGAHRIRNHYCTKLAQINLERLQYIPPGGSWRDIPFQLLPKGLQRARRSDHTKRYGRLHPDGLCSTILTKCDPHWGSFFHPEKDRVLSVREAARLQSFPDCFSFTGSLTEQYEQVGNAVPPLMAQAIGNCIRGLIGGENATA